MTSVCSSQVSAHVSFYQAGGPEEALNAGVPAQAPAAAALPVPWPPTCARPACCCPGSYFQASQAVPLSLALSCSRWFSLLRSEVAAVDGLACAA